MTEVPVWTCEFGGVPEHPTVGDHFRMHCRGDIAVDWSSALPVIKTAKPDQEFSLQILSAEELKPQSAQFVVTGYRPGEHAPDYLRVMQGGRGFEVEKPKWKFESILSKESPPPSPYPSIGPYRVSGPLWLVLVLYLVVGVGLLLGARGLYRWLRRRAFRRRLAELKTALPPVRQFYRDARALRRRLNAAAAPAELGVIGHDLNQQFRRMITREFEVPALELSDAKISREFKTRFRKFTVVAGDQMRKILRELSRATAATEMAPNDLDQLLRMCVDFAETVERERS